MFFGYCNDDEMTFGSYNYRTDLEMLARRQSKIDRTPVLTTTRLYNAYSAGSMEVYGSHDYNSAITEYLTDCGLLAYGDEFVFDI